MELLIRRKYHKAANVAKAISVLLLMVFEILGSFVSCLSIFGINGLSSSSV
jgi:hypothetical protein